MEEHPTEMYYRGRAPMTIVEGTSQIQLGLIAKGVSVTISGGTE